MGCCENWTDETTFHFWNILSALDSVAGFILLYSNLAKPPQEDVAERVRQNTFVVYVSAIFGTVTAVLYLISVLDPANTSNKVKVYYMNVACFVALYFALAGDTVY